MGGLRAKCIVIYVLGPMSLCVRQFHVARQAWQYLGVSEVLNHLLYAASLLSNDEGVGRLCLAFSLWWNSLLNCTLVSCRMHYSSSHLQVNVRSLIPPRSLIHNTSNYGVMSYALGGFLGNSYRFDLGLDLGLGFGSAVACMRRSLLLEYGTKSYPKNFLWAKRAPSLTKTLVLGSMPAFLDMKAIAVKAINVCRPMRNTTSCSYPCHRTPVHPSSHRHW